MTLSLYLLVPNAVTNLKVSLTDYNKVYITWSSPRPIRGVIQLYKVSYNSSDGDVKVIPTTETSIELRDLQYNSTFYIWVVAKTSKGYGMVGRILSITTGRVC